MHTLHGRQGSGSAAVEALLALLGLPYRLENVPRGKPSPDYLKLNPLGQVPTLVLPGGAAMTESAAMMIYLADLDGTYRYAPRPDSPLRPRYLRFMVYLAANPYMTDLRFMYPQRYTADPAGADAVKQAAIVRYAEEWQVLADALGDGPFFVSETISALDLYAAMIAMWDLDMPAFFSRHPNVRRFCARVFAEPAIAEIWKHHDLTVI